MKPVTDPPTTRATGCVHVHIVLCAFQPDLAFLSRQLASISAQTHAKWSCQVRLDPGTREYATEIQALLNSDARFSLVVNTSRLGVYRNFEAGLWATPDEADVVAYCDQDDEWLPSKLSDCLAAFDDADVVLVHSDLEAIDAEGRRLFASCFASEKRITDDYSLSQLIIRNAVTGCTCMFRAALRPYLLPFPDQNAAISFHHDLWTALVATQLGRIATINHPLVRYRQHGANLVGVEAIKRRTRRTLSRLQASSWKNNWTLRAQLIRAVLQRDLPDLRAEAKQQRREIDQWLKARFVSPSLLRKAISLKARGYPAGDAALQTVLGKAVVAIGALRDGTTNLRVRAASMFHRTKLLARASLAFALQPIYRRRILDTLDRLEPHNGPASLGDGIAPRYGEQYLAPLPLTFTALKPRVVIVVPTGRVAHIFGGLTTIFKFGVALAQHGIAIRFLSIDHILNGDDISSLKDFLRERCGFDGDWEAIEIASSSIRGVPANRSDVFVATIWWSARRIFHTLESHNFQHESFYYFIQDYEPGFYAWSNEYALAKSTYAMACRPIVNTQFLADYLLSEAGLHTPKNRVFNPEIDWAMFRPAEAKEMRSREKRRLIFYGRPDTPRNLFHVGLAAIRRFIRDCAIDADAIEVISAGEAHDPIDLGRNVMMQSVGKLEMADYAAILRSSDVGLSLMLSPHPSYPPFEMAASGLTVVTNNFGTKHMEFGGNIIACIPVPEELAKALARAWARSSDAEGRIEGAHVDLSSLGRSLKHLIPEIAAEMKPLLQADDGAGSSQSLAANTGLHYQFGFGGDHDDFSNKRVCLFSHFDVHNTIDAHVLNYLAALKDEGFEIVLISSNLQLDPRAVAAAKALCRSLIYRENQGYDFAGWALALRLIPSLRHADELLMCNDSVYGPLSALRPIFEKMDAEPCDFWGITESLEVTWHIQSYFLVFKRSTLASRSFWDFWMNVRVMADKKALIHAYELSLARVLVEEGLRPGVLVASAKVSGTICNPTLDPWRQTLAIGRSPFLKVQLLRDNPLGSDITGWQRVVADLGYDPTLIQKHLARMRTF